MLNDRIVPSYCTVRRFSFPGFNLLLSVFNVSRCVDTNFAIMLAVVFF